ncbi:MAG: protein-L-isoaspartate O-methyltransferase [Candidatus Handelsmanbacteria bacterium RIFCSPLOWO2_12_FULL_64_10]|uniref:Protein-L-isoaspartate O-methyltransferase n=1 Tax=Handelsmanbacteria sp. (strain RIFCSPLOWO2_12_FULL_64_10) TaxID=1817868 RepID=A0A1F6CSI5_HANXR|nr:MAG: protein-L-isoaspartate O-methyltransferase [Candidatus Handelsmanbacteria bacterium RIFCSPLOWO2_12_FULL_64_10]
MEQEGVELSSPSLTAREKLVAQLSQQGITDPRVLAAVAHVPRERFLPEALRDRAYENVALPIAEEQTISQPYIVGAMGQALGLTGTETVLEIGTGSGYGAAILAELAAKVISVELRFELAAAAAERLRGLNYRSVSVVLGDGSVGWPLGAPYDAISVTACAPEVPPVLLRQLSNRGRLVAPIGSQKEQHLILVERRETHFHARNLGPVRFVPLLGAAGFRLLDRSRRN